MSAEGIGLWRPNAQQRRADGRAFCSATTEKRDPEHPEHQHRCEVFRGHVMSGHRCRCGHVWPVERPRSGRVRRAKA